MKLNKGIRKKKTEKIILALNNPNLIFQKLQRLLGIKVQRNVNITNLCRGDGIEIGALSSPKVFPFATSIQYADVYTKEGAKNSLEKLGYFGYHKRKFVEVDIVFDPKAPPLQSIESESKDFIFSSHSLEHSPNPISALVDYLRVAKSGGVVYTIIPNKKFTYDRKRTVSSVEKLIHKYKNNEWDYTIDEYRDVFENSDTHVVYDNKNEEDIIKAFNENSGHHHIYVYDEESTLKIIDFVSHQVACDLVFFDSSSEFEIHFAIRKR
jgi:predicted SAM-dependent methyltransferase